MKKVVTVAVCGVQPRIGTTTQALQMVAYLQMMGYAVAYVELAGQGYIKQMRKLYRDISMDGKCITYERIPLYQNIIDVNTNEELDFLVKDYGSMDKDTFNQVSFLEQDIYVICTGVKPNEIFNVNEVLKRPEYTAAKFIFSFVPSDQREGILALMTNRAENTFFANLNPDPFSYDSTMNKNYHLILGQYMAEFLPAVSRKKSIRIVIKSWLIVMTAKARRSKNYHMLKVLTITAYSLGLIALYQLFFA